MAGYRPPPNSLSFRRLVISPPFVIRGDTVERGQNNDSGGVLHVRSRFVTLPCARHADMCSDLGTCLTYESCDSLLSQMALA